MSDEKITISIDRYDQLLDIETRANVLVERIIDNNYLSTSDILGIIGTPAALKEAKALNDKEKSERETYMEQKNKNA